MTAFSYIKFVPPHYAWLGFQTVANMLIIHFLWVYTCNFTSELCDFWTSLWDILCDVQGSGGGLKGEGQFPSQCFCKEKKNNNKTKYHWGAAVNYLQIFAFCGGGRSLEPNPTTTKGWVKYSVFSLLVCCMWKLLHCVSIFKSLYLELWQLQLPTNIGMVPVQYSELRLLTPQ